MSNYKDCPACQLWLESSLRADKGKRIPREFWIRIDHSLSGPMTVEHNPIPHSIHVREVEDESFSDEGKE